jgi:hypothetical protein
MNSKQRIIFVGDHHGDYAPIFKNLEKYNIKDCLLVCVGDGGEGFMNRSKQMRYFELLNEKFAKYQVKYLSIRGNHSDPQYFDGSVCMSNFELLPDYTKREMNGEKFLFIGGAVSVDRILRRPEISWWVDEEIVFKPELIEPCDVLVTHSSPDWNGPNDKSGISGWCDKDPTLWLDCLRERRIMNEIIQLSQPKFHFCGHFHCSSIATNNKCYSRILDVNELYEHKTFS